jgi:hypothetical protein
MRCIHVFGLGLDQSVVSQTGQRQNNMKCAAQAGWLSRVCEPEWCMIKRRDIESPRPIPHHP